MKKRAVTEDERRLFERTLAASRPVKVPAPPPKSRSRPRKPTPEARLDLHGHTEAAAHRALLAFLRNARRLGLRRVLVITGKARPLPLDAPYDMELDRRARGVLKNAVPRWLNEKEFSALISGTEPAARREGGDGALYVLIRK